jgi:hypothetical protein
MRTRLAPAIFAGAVISINFVAVTLQSAVSWSRQLSSADGKYQ